MTTRNITGYITNAATHVIIPELPALGRDFRAVIESTFPGYATHTAILALFSPEGYAKLAAYGFEEVDDDHQLEPGTSEKKIVFLGTEDDIEIFPKVTDIQVDCILFYNHGDVEFVEMRGETVEAQA